MDLVISTAPAPTAWTVDDDGNIHFTLISNGFSPQSWEQHLECHGWRIGNAARNALHCANTAPTNGVTYKIVMSLGIKIRPRDLVTKKIRAIADKKGWFSPHWEVACLIRDAFADKELGLMGLSYIVTMHEPIYDFGGIPLLLYSNRCVDGRWLYARRGGPDDYWNGRGGFAFARKVDL